jgi:hypothetical protein
MRLGRLCLLPGGFVLIVRWPRWRRGSYLHTRRWAAAECAHMTHIRATDAHSVVDEGRVCGYDPNRGKLRLAEWAAVAEHCQRPRLVHEQAAFGPTPP